MERKLEKLKSFLDKKISRQGNKERIIKKQINILEKLEKEENSEKEIVSLLLKKIGELETHKEFDVPYEEYKKIIKEKNVESHIERIFFEDINKAKQIIRNVKEILLAQQKSFSEEYFEPEKQKYAELEQLLKKIIKEKEVINQYFKDMSNLKYNKKYVKGARISSRIIKNMMFRVLVTGEENIPGKGTAILAPHHVDSAFDPIILKSVINRKIFFLGSVEPFTSSKAVASIYNKIGIQPFKRTDSNFGNVRPGLKSEEELHKYNSSNKETINNMLRYAKYGELLVVFPEGDTLRYGRYIRDENQQFIPLQPGFINLVLIAKRIMSLDIPIIPIGIKYGKGLLGKGIFTTVTINIGKPVYLQMNGENRKEMTEHYCNYFLEEIKKLSQ